MVTERIPAECFPPGEFIRDELDARGWTRDAFAAMIKTDRSTVDGIIDQHAVLTPPLAWNIGRVFETSAEVWLNLESAYRAWLRRYQGIAGGAKVR